MNCGALFADKVVLLTTTKTIYSQFCSYGYKCKFTAIMLTREYPPFVKALLVLLCLSLL